jgi:hypothetical protein
VTVAVLGPGIAIIGGSGFGQSTAALGYGRINVGAVRFRCGHGSGAERGTAGRRTGRTWH